MRLEERYTKEIKDAMMKKYALIGMALMAALLALIDYLKDDIKNEKEVEQKLDTKLFGTIYHETKNKTLRFKSCQQHDLKLLFIEKRALIFYTNRKPIVLITFNY